MIAHSIQMPGKHVRKIEFYRLQRCKQLCWTSSDFTVLARCCINLNELIFDNELHWELLNKLDFSHYWKQLRRIPPIDDKNPICRHVCYQLEDRLTDLTLLGFTNCYDICTLLLRLSHLQYLTIQGSLTLTLTEASLMEIHQSVPLLKRLDLDTNIQLTNNHAQLTLLPNVIRSNHQHLRCLHCHILGPRSAWLQLIRFNYNNIHELLLDLFDPYLPSVMSDKRCLSREESMDTVNSVFHLIKYTPSLYQLRVRFEQFVADVDFIKYYTSGLINEYNSNKSKTSVSIQLSFLDNSFPYRDFFATKSCFQSRTIIRSRNSKEQNIYHTLNYDFGLQATEKRDEIVLLTCIFESSIRLLTTHLSLKLERRSFDTNVYRSLFHDLSIIFEHFPRLKELSLHCQYYRSQFTNDSYRIDGQAKTYLSLTTLRLNNMVLDMPTYHHLLELFPNLTSLYVKNWHFEKPDVILSLEQLCEEKNIKFYFSNK
ncbi:MAG: hypothetical protein EXX96DRAFT_615540 [Benjaminiella poitrasii]|nr:MAG: hypothetical protein EXX96DRAFT_615540 [Benjaminiella poitrasii]